MLGGNSYKGNNKFPGKTLERGLNWNTHITLQKAEAKRSLNILNTKLYSVCLGQFESPEMTIVQKYSPQYYHTD